MDIYKIIGFIICIVIGTIVFKLINKHVTITWAKIIILWISGLFILFFGVSIESLMLLYFGLILAGIGTLLGFGKMYGGN